MNSIKKILGGGIPLGFVTATALALSGCGGEGSDGSEGNAENSYPNTQSVTLSARNATYSTGYTESFEVDLSSKVFSSTGGGFILSEVEVLSNDSACQVDNITESGFVIQASDAKVCDYRYHVIPKTAEPMSQKAEVPMVMSASSELSSSAITRIAVSSEPTETELVPVSGTTLINKPKSFYLDQELAKAGFTLSDEFVLTSLTLPDEHGSSAQIGGENVQSVDYVPAQGFTGIDRVLYTFEDQAKGLVLMGVLDIAVGYEANQGFTIDDNIEHPEVVDVFTVAEIDISDFVISDDADDYQLVYVETFNAEVAAKDPLDTSNKIIKFQASEPGYHYISFAVSDHNGAYDMGLIRVEVVDPNQTAQWGDIPHLLDVYIGPPTVLDVIAQGETYSMLIRDAGYTPAIDMAGFRYARAKDYCNAIGATLPTLVQLQGMTADVDVKAIYDWPTQTRYIAYDEISEMPMAVELGDGVGDGASVPVDPAFPYYVTCMKQGLINELPSETIKEAVANGVDEAKVAVELKLGQEAKPGTQITASVSSQHVTLESDTVTTDSSGKAVFRLTSYKAEEVTLTLEVGGVGQDYIVEFIGNEKTAQVSSETTIDSVNYSSVDGAQVTATLTDENSNPLEGYSVTSEASSETHPDTELTVKPILIKEAHQTDEFGVQKVRVKWDSQYETPTTNMTFDVTSSYTTTGGDRTESTSQVTFKAYVCGGRVGDNDKANAAGDCIKIAESNGKLFTGSASVSFLEAIDYEGYGVTDVNPIGSFGITTLSDSVKLCAQYNNINLMGKSDWRLASKDELLRLFDDYGNMWHAKGWATDYRYWSSTPNGSDYYGVSLSYGRVDDYHPSIQRYASCVSGP